MANTEDQVPTQPASDVPSDPEMGEQENVQTAEHTGTDSEADGPQVTVPEPATEHTSLPQDPESVGAIGGEQEDAEVGSDDAEFDDAASEQAESAHADPEPDGADRDRVDYLAGKPTPIPMLSNPPRDPLAPNWAASDSDAEADSIEKDDTDSTHVIPRVTDGAQPVPSDSGSAVEDNPTEVLAALPLGTPETVEEPVTPPAPRKRTKKVTKKTAEKSGVKNPGKKKTGRKVLIGAVVTIVLLAGAYVGAQWFVSDKVARGTTVAGIEIGGMTTDEALAKLDGTLGKAIGTPIEVTAADLSTELVPGDSGVVFDGPQTIAGLSDFTLEPKGLWMHITGGTAIEPVVRIDNDKFDTAMTTVASSLMTEPVNGTVGFEKNEAVMTEAVDGTKVEVAGTSALILDKLFTNDRPLAAVVGPIDPEITAEATAQGYETAQRIAAGPITVNVGDQKAEIPTDVFVPLASVSVENGKIEFSFDGEQLTEAVIDRTSDLLVSPKNAYFTFEEGKPNIVAGKPGTSLDSDELTQSFQAVATSTERVATVELVEKTPESGVAELETLGVKELVASFSTPLTNEPVRTQNLQVAADKITGTLIEPGEDFNLVKVIGPITAANGYRNAGVVVNGIHTDGMGGGLSQMSTTSYNAGFFAGMVDVAHRPHSYHFTRYPEGREATLFVGSIDMIWRNDSPHGVLMRSYTAGGKLTVEAWSTKHYDVATSTSARYNVVPSKVVNSTAANCAYYPRGNPGFGVTVYRKVTDIETGTVVIDEKNSWTYKPDNGVTCN